MGPQERYLLNDIKTQNAQKVNMYFYIFLQNDRK